MLETQNDSWSFNHNNTYLNEHFFIINTLNHQIYLIVYLFLIPDFIEQVLFQIHIFLDEKHS